MTAEIEPCVGLALPELHEAMSEAFSDYLVPMALSQEQFGFMLRQRGFDPTLSRVTRAEGRIVAFWLIGAAPEAWPESAYVIATGTLPRYRSQGLSRQVFAAVRERLAGAGKSSLRLEVIEDNSPAVKLYDKLGFRRLRRLACYGIQGPLAAPSRAGGFDLRPCSLANLQDQGASMQDWQPSWQNDFHSLLRVAGDCVALGAFEGGRCQGYGLLLRPTATVAQLAVDAKYRRQGLGSAILAKLTEGQSGLKVLNLDENDSASTAFFERHGATGRIVQIELTCPIAD